MNQVAIMQPKVASFNLINPKARLVVLGYMDPQLTEVPQRQPHSW